MVMVVLHQAAMVAGSVVLLAGLVLFDRAAIHTGRQP